MTTLRVVLVELAAKTPVPGPHLPLPATRPRPHVIAIAVSSVNPARGNRHRLELDVGGAGDDVDLVAERPFGDP